LIRAWFARTISMCFEAVILRLTRLASL
jgi:hypothetical protein